VQPAQPPRGGGLARGHDQGERQLPRQPVPQPSEHRAQVDEVRGIARGLGQIAQYPAGAISEAGQRGGRPDGQRPEEACGRGHGQPLRPPAAHPADDLERDRQQDRELGEQ
jgi:hypothetical protein